MIFERTFNLALDEATARRRQNSYFEKAGYRILANEGPVNKFSRGSARGSWFPLNPADNQTVASARINPDGQGRVKVQIEFDVAVKFRDETNFTDEFWEQELKEFGLALNEDKYFPLKSKMLTGRAAWAILRSLGTGIAFILIWGALSFLLTFLILYLSGYYTTKSNTDATLVAFIVMVVMAIATWYFYRFWSRRQKDKIKRKKT